VCVCVCVGVCVYVRVCVFDMSLYRSAERAGDDTGG
jgi:hypothetical protein